MTELSPTAQAEGPELDGGALRGVRACAALRITGGLDRRWVLEPGGPTAFRNDSNSIILTAPGPGASELLEADLPGRAGLRPVWRVAPGHAPADAPPARQPVRHCISLLTFRGLLTAFAWPSAACSLPLLGLPRPVHCLSLTFRGLFTAFPRPPAACSLPFLDLPRPFHCLSRCLFTAFP